MKKLILILLTYVLLVFLLITGLVHAFLDLPVLIKGAESSYRFTAVTLCFFTLMPPILLSGFTVACAVTWKKSDSISRRRFSQAMFDRLKTVIVISIGLVFFLSMNEEVLVPSFQKKLNHIENAPMELESALSTTRNLLNQGHPYIALQYAKRAVDIAPKDEEAISTLKKAQDAVDLEHDRQMYRKITDAKVVKPIHDEHAGYTILQLLERSKEAAEKKQWFDAHYWAQLAVDACDGTNTNLPAATQAANYAWKQLNLPVEFDNSAEREYYKKKREGYKAYVSGDDLKAYYIFLSLGESPAEKRKDPDVIKFFELAKENVENQYFFFDETENMNQLADSQNVYFTLDYPDGTSNVFYISKSMDIKRDGGLVRYLEDFNVIHYDSNGDFRYSFHVPYAKVTAQLVSEIDESNHASLGISRKWKSVPVITLQSVDRTTEGVISKPVFEFDRTGIPVHILDKLGMKALEEEDSMTSVISFVNVPKSTMMILPMPFSDFHVINEASSGADTMSLLSLYKFLPDAVEYGFSKEVFVENFLQRITYPFIALIMLILCASIAWNYRIDDPKEIFKFRWILLIPALGTITLFIFSAFRYLFTMANYVLIGTCGSGALVAAFAMYITLLFGTALLFVSRRS